MSSFAKNNFAFLETYSPVSNSISYDKHIHSAYELYYFIAGDADYMVRDTVYHLQKHDLIFVRPSVYHSLKTLSAKPYHRIVINFTEKHISNSVLSDLDQLETHYRIPADSLIDRYYQNGINIIKKYNENDAYSCLLHHLDLILTELKYNEQYTNIATSDIIHPLFHKILDFIDNNLNLPLNVEILSKEFFASRSWIMHSFRKFLNISVTEYIMRKKILYAQQLIVSGNPAMQAAKLCGFDNYSTFYKQYKNLLGISPAKTK